MSERSIQVDFYELMDELIKIYGKETTLDILRILLSIEENKS